MKKLIVTVVAAMAPILSAIADPYTFTPQDYLEYGIYFAPRGSGPVSSGKLLNLRFGDIEGWYARYLPEFKAPSRKQLLRLVTGRGSVRVNRNDNVGLTVSRDTYKVGSRSSTKRLEVRFENATCTDADGASSACVVNLLLTVDGPDRGVIREPRTLVITTSTGLSFRYRTVRRDGGKPLNLPLLRRTPVINNYAWEWRAGQE
jgi:hypothetical protein